MTDAAADFKRALVFGGKATSVLEAALEDMSRLAPWQAHATGQGFVVRTFDYGAIPQEASAAYLVLLPSNDFAAFSSACFRAGAIEVQPKSSGRCPHREWGPRVPCRIKRLHYAFIGGAARRHFLVERLLHRARSDCSNGHVRPHHPQPRFARMRHHGRPRSRDRGLERKNRARLDHVFYLRFRSGRHLQFGELKT